MCWRIILGGSEVHTLSHSTVNNPLLSLRVQYLIRKWAQYLVALSKKPISPSFVRRCKLDRGTLKIAPRRVYQDIAVRTCR
jgi:hypothetical protein